MADVASRILPTFSSKFLKSLMNDREFEIAVEENRIILAKIRVDHQYFHKEDMNNFFDVIQTRSGSSTRRTKHDVYYKFFEEGVEPPFWCGVREINAEQHRIWLEENDQWTFWGSEE